MPERAAGVDGSRRVPHRPADPREQGPAPAPVAGQLGREAPRVRQAHGLGDLPGRGPGRFPGGIRHHQPLPLVDRVEEAVGLGEGFGGRRREKPARRGAALFWGASWLCRVQLDAGVAFGGFDKKRRWGGQKPAVRPPPNFKGAEDGGGLQQDNFKLVTHYRPILFVDFIAPGELVVVERPLVDILAKLPPAFFKAKYGAT